MQTENTAAGITQRLIEPLCEATEKLLQPIRLKPNDRLQVQMSDDHESFVTQAYAVHPCRGCNGTGRVAVRQWGETTVAEDGDEQDCEECNGEGEKRTAGSHDASYTWARRIPERKEIGHGRWNLKATDFAAIVINATWPRDRIDFEDDESQVFYDYLLARFVQQTLGSRVKADFKLNGIVPEPPEDFVDHPCLPLKPYQRVAAQTTFGIEGSALFMEMSTGKTPIVISRLMHEARQLDEDRMYRVIVVCPKNVRTNWKNELERFATLPGRVTVLRGGKLNRLKQLVEVLEDDGESKWCCVIASYETVKLTWDALRMFEWDLAVVDESHNIKSARAQRTHAMMNLRDRSAQRMCLTGTEMGNDVIDLYSQLEFLGKGMSGFSNFNAFKEYYHRYQSKKTGSRRRVKTGYKNMPILKERLARLAFTCTKAEVLPDLPDKMPDIVEVGMGRKQAEYYAKVQKELAVELEADMVRAAAKGASTLTVTHVLTKLLRLSQITAGYMVMDKEYDDDGNFINEDERIIWFDDVPKMRVLLEEIKNSDPKSKIIVWTCWIPVIHAISAALTMEDIAHVTFFGGTKDVDREKAIRNFNESAHCKVFIGHPKAGGVGVNLPGSVPDLWDTPDDHGCNADRTIYYAMNWSLFDRKQSEDRNHGQGRCRTPVRVSDFIVPGTIDEEIRDRVVGKVTAAKELRDVKDIMKRVLQSVPLNGDEE